ncbi:2927_t:CDS:2 [Funneliformis geosporum]|nr:2927_t:CDS:2 [Funneliformis geosporum]
MQPVPNLHTSLKRPVEDERKKGDLHDELTIWNWKSITDYHIDLLCYFSETDDMGGVELVLNRRPSEEFSITSINIFQVSADIESIRIFCNIS